MRSRLLLLAFLGLALVQVHTQTSSPKDDRAEQKRAAQMRVYLDSLRAQCESMGRVPDCYKDAEKQLQDEIDRFNRRMTEKAEREMRPPGKQKFHFVTKART
jgi:hypothetical protein